MSLDERDEHRHPKGGWRSSRERGRRASGRRHRRLFRQAADLPDVADLATKADVALAKAEIGADIAEFKAEIDGRVAGLDSRIAGLDARSDSGIAGLDARTDSRFASLDTRLATIDAKLATLMWMIGILGGGALVLQVLTATLRLVRVA